MCRQRWPLGRVTNPRARLHSFRTLYASVQACAQRCELGASRAQAAAIRQTRTLGTLLNVVLLLLLTQDRVLSCVPHMLPVSAGREMHKRLAGWVVKRKQMIERSYALQVLTGAAVHLRCAADAAPGGRTAAGQRRIRKQEEGPRASRVGVGTRVDVWLAGTLPHIFGGGRRLGGFGLSS